MNLKNDDWFLSLVRKALKDSDKEITASKLSEMMREVISKTIPESANILLKELKSNSSKMLEERRRYEREFEEHLYQRWEEPLDLLEMFLEIALEVGAEFNEDYKDEASKTNDYVFDVLTKMHIRGCQISFEILSLLKSGLADGAYARWRTLHEIACISNFIVEHGQDVAKRFLQYEIVVAYKQAQAYQKYCRQLGYEPLTKEELEKLKKDLDYVCKIYGKDFKKYYGWVPRGILKQRNLAEIEKSVKLDHLRPYYNMASFLVHSGPKGILFKLGLRQDKSEKEILLAGPSDFGLADPGQSSAISLYQITACLLSISPTMMKLVTIKAMQNLLDEICKAFVEVHTKMKKEKKVTYLGIDYSTLYQ